ncbi:MAG: hypothetical protein LBB45_00575 [Methanobrevibacter sp.]|jgi:hypothetical protein|nr:hypothetical protein [Candidatus Methanovirga basalitermitum]
MKFLRLIPVAVVMLILIFGFNLWYVTQNSLVEPVGRLTVNKLGNPDMFPGHASSQVLRSYAAKTGTKCILVVHYAGGTTYARYHEDEDVLAPDGIFVIELTFVDSAEYKTDVDWLGDVIPAFLFGIPEGKYEYKADGIVFDNLDYALKYVSDLAKSRGQEGPLPMFFHGTTREELPYFNPGCGFPLFVQISWKQYGRLGAYYYTIKGLMWPYVSNIFYPYQISHYSGLNYLYNNDKLNYETISSYKYDNNSNSLSSNYYRSPISNSRKTFEI